MKGLLKKTATFRAATFLAVVTAALGTISLTSQSTATASSAACVCDTANSSYNPGLPASHPSNRCASQSQDLSWKSWLSGKSQNNQLHFIDLFELLYGHKSAPMNSNNSPINGE